MDSPSTLDLIDIAEQLHRIEPEALKMISQQKRDSDRVAAIFVNTIFAIAVLLHGLFIVIISILIGSFL